MKHLRIQHMITFQKNTYALSWSFRLPEIRLSQQSGQSCCRWPAQHTGTAGQRRLKGKGRHAGHCPAGEVPITRSSQGETAGLGPDTCPPPSPGSTREDGKPWRNQNTRVGVCNSSSRKEGETATGQDVWKILAVGKPMGLTVLKGEPGAAPAQNLAWGEEAGSGEPLSISPRTDCDLLEL